MYKQKYSDIKRKYIALTKGGGMENMYYTKSIINNVLPFMYFGTDDTKSSLIKVLEKKHKKLDLITDTTYDEVKHVIQNILNLIQTNDTSSAQLILKEHYRDRVSDTNFIKREYTYFKEIFPRHIVGTKWEEFKSKKKILDQLLHKKNINEIKNYYYDKIMEAATILKDKNADRLSKNFAKTELKELKTEQKQMIKTIPKVYFVEHLLNLAIDEKLKDYITILHSNMKNLTTKTQESIKNCIKYIHTHHPDWELLGLDVNVYNAEKIMTDVDIFAQNVVTKEYFGVEIKTSTISEDQTALQRKLFQENRFIHNHIKNTLNIDDSEKSFRFSKYYQYTDSKKLFVEL